MAGLPWFKFYAGMTRHPKSVRLGAKLQNPLAFGFVVRLWEWCSEYAKDGRIEGEDAAAIIEQACGWAGKPGKLVEALLACGWLERDGDAYVVHDWLEANAAHAAKAERDAKKPRGNKKRPAPVPRGTAEGPPPDDGGTPGGSRAGPAPVPPPSPPDPAGEIQTEREREVPVASQPDHRGVSPPDDPPWLAGLNQVREQLGKHFRRPGPLGLGKDEQRTKACFARWLQTVGVELTVAECARLAAEAGTTPSHLAWFVGWLETVSDARLAQAARAAGGGA